MASLTQVALATKAGVSVEVVKRLEGNGRINMESLARIAIALNASAALLDLFPVPEARTLDELERRDAQRTRVNVVRKDAGVPRGPRKESAS